jgi:NNP family nitrate/nitrite transporter-like MFS transporter
MSFPSSQQPLTRLNVLSLKGIQMKSFHITWLMFFVCFFGWFGLAPLMPTIRENLHLTKGQVGNLIIVSVSSTIIARLIIGKLCDSWGPRKTAVRLLLLGSLPVFLVGLSKDYTSFLLFRAAIGIIGASFVITQFHTSIMFASNIKGTANAVAGGWGNLGGGVTNIVMPLIFAAIVGKGF